MKFGLSDNDFNTLNRLVFLPLKSLGFKVFVFGSRARGKYHPFSDIDVLIVNPSRLDKSKVYPLKEAIEEARFPLKVDFVFDDELAESYRDQVETDKISL